MNQLRLLTAVNALFYVALGISAPLFTLYLEALGANYATISLILTSVVIASIVANPLWGRLSDALGRRKPLLVIGLFGLGIAYFLLSQATGPAWAWASRLMEGISVAAYGTVSLAIMGDLMDQTESARAAAGRSPQRGRDMGLYRGIGSLAFAAGAMLGGRVADAYSLSQTFLVCSALHLASGTLALALRDAKAPAPTAAEIAADQADAGAQRRNSKLPVLFLAGVLLWTAAHSASTSMWPNYMASLGYSKTALSSLWGLAALVEMPAMFIVGALSDTTGRAIMLAAGGFAIGAVNLGYVFVAQYLPALLGVQVLRGFGFGSYTTSAMSFTAEYGVRRVRGRTSGIFMTAGSTGQLIGILLGGNIAQALGFQPLFFVCALLGFGSGVCFLLLRTQGARTLRVTTPAQS